ncbi:general secretion pathway protein E [Pseudacidovorax intermedius]|uniref:General secretion pathway protein E n=1 Tax=Pseudacidovorax intermedius TaxID=433924 RepID=A0A370FAC5_9BURK|nr:GspE/PulE family protein [Pseudacidovorax intermedius]RDI21883.1 general secretion pathway protein E [Pseudacidovorax intermedius]
MEYSVDRLSGLMALKLQEREILSRAEASYAQQKQRVEVKPLWRVLIDNGLVRERIVCALLGELLEIEFADLDQVSRPGADILSLFNRELCQKSEFLPLRRDSEHLLVLLGDANPTEVQQLVLRRCGLRSRFVLGEFSRVRTLIRHSFFFAQNPIVDLIEAEIRNLAGDKDGNRSPAAFLQHLLHLAVQERATDIHIAPAASSIHVLLRVDGVLRPAFALPLELTRIGSYIKLIAEIDISEKRKPQDGSFHTRILDVPHTVRLSTIVTDIGERMVMRLLPESHDLKGLREIGYYEEDTLLLEQGLRRPSGLVVITGPTGSGKSSTLHAALRMQNLIERNVLTVEDPVEYRVPGAGQTEVNRKTGYDFQSALRHFLRHDPDVILVGEMRDSETAVAALDAATTGHLVLSTLHVNSVFGAVPRLQLLGGQASIVAENLLLVVHQRLARKNCSECAESVELTERECRWLGRPLGSKGMRGKGCPNCRGTGYYGRVPVYEVLAINDELADLIAGDARRAELRRAAERSGFRDIESCAKRRVVDGATTCDEIVRCLGVGP